MTPHSLNLRSEDPALLVEFHLRPGTHATIGASSDAEITLPLTGLADFACKIGCTQGGAFYVSAPDGSNLRPIHLPAALTLQPYHFVIFHPEGATHSAPLDETSKPSAVNKALVVVGVSLALVIAAAFFILQQRQKPAPTSSVVNMTPAAQSTVPPLTPAPPTPAVPIASGPPAKPEIVPLAAAPTPEAPAEPKLDLEALAKRVAPAVFRLVIRDGVGNPAGTGTAFAISADGLAVTNYHVVEKGDSFVAQTSQGAEYAVLGISAIDPEADLALVSIKGSDLPFLELGESESAKIGAPLAVFGAPEGLSGTLSEGILSARRNDPGMAESNVPNGGRVLQISAPISPGSSGSPVFDRNGKVIGVAAAAFVSKGTQNLNFAIPVEAVSKLRSDAAAGLAKTAQSLAPKPQTAKPSATPKDDDPSQSFLSDPAYQDFKTALDSRDWIAALKAAKKLVAKYPDISYAHRCHGLALMCLSLYEEAERSAQRSVALDAEDGAAWNLLGKIQELQNNIRASRVSWKRAASLEPEDPNIWQNLAASFLTHEQYADAVQPLESLRKLNRAEFIRILSIVRSLRRQSPEIRALIRHFDELVDEGTASSSPEKLAASLVAGFLRHGEGPDIQTELADYAAHVNPYFDQGMQDQAGILKDIASYRSNWPKRTLTLVAVESARQDEAGTLEATYRLRYSASNGKRTRKGTLIQGIRYVLTDGKWLVAGIQTLERVSDP